MTTEARHHDSGGFCGYCSSERAFEPWPCDAARARAEIVRLRAALTDTSLAYDTGFQDGLGEGSAEIARLRKIEEAAREFITARDADRFRPGTPADRDRRWVTEDALRAALSEADHD